MAILTATLPVYLPAIRGGYIGDDDFYVSENQSLRSFDGLRRIGLDIRTNPQYYPLVHTSYWIEYRLWKTNPMGFHVVNVVLHALNALLLWAVPSRLRLPGAPLNPPPKTPRSTTSLPKCSTASEKPTKPLQPASSPSGSAPVSSRSTHNDLGALPATQSRLEEAIGHFEEALRIDPQDKQAQHNLARARADLKIPSKNTQAPK